MAGVGVGGERRADQGSGVPAATVLGPDGDGGYVELAQDVADPDLPRDPTPLFDHEVEGERALELSAPDRRTPGPRKTQGVYLHDRG